MSPWNGPPGVYIQEKTNPQPIIGAETALTAFVGSARKGPVGIPVLISSFREYEQCYGTLAIEHTTGYAIRDYFINGGKQALVLRLTGKGAGCAQINLAGDANETENAVWLEARSPGNWGNEVSVQIKKAKLSGAALRRRIKPGSTLPRFHINVFLRQQLAESFPDVSMKPGDAAFLPDILEQHSQLLRVSKVNGNWSLPDGLTIWNQEEVQAAGGHDGDMLSVADYLGNETEQTGMYALRKADLFNLLCIPPPQRAADTDPAVYRAALRLCAERRAMLLVDAPCAWAVDAIPADFQADTWLGLSDAETRNAAVFFPRLRQADTVQNGIEDVFVPCGAVAGIIADNDARRGVWKAPAGMDAELKGVKALQTNVTETEWTMLNAAGVNCLRTGTDQKTRIWGARTLRGSQQSNDAYKYVSVRRTALHIEESVLRGIGWVSFELNDERCWNVLREKVSDFMMTLFRAGAFQGTSPDQAFFVRCGPDTTTQSDMDNGWVHLLIGFAPLQPAEFLMLKISQRTATP